MNRAYSLLRVKEVDEEKRILTGIATTPTPDRMGDVVEPKGAEFNLPIPFLWQHDSRQPLGHVTKAKVTKEGIEVEVQLTKIDEAGKLKERLDEAWQSIKAGLVRGLSIGFASVETSYLRDTGGLHFIKWLWLELSAVTIAANGDCSIQGIKSADATLMVPRTVNASDDAPAATGNGRAGDVKRRTGASVKALTATQQRQEAQRSMKKPVAEQISAFEATRAAKAARMEDLMDAAAEKGETLDEAAREEYDTLAGELKQVDDHLVRLRDMERSNKAKAKPVDGSNGDAAAQSRSGLVPATVKAAKPAPGIRMARYARCLAISHKEHKDIVRVAEALYGQRDPAVVAMVKAAGTAVGALDTTDAAALIGNEGGFADFAEFLRPQTILGKFGAGGIPSLRSVPFRVPLINQSGGGSAWWVGEGDGKPLTKLGVGRTELAPLKIATIAVATMETLRDSSPSAEILIRDDIAAAVIVRMDASFIDPTNAGSANVSPAAITYNLGGQVVEGSGATADAVRQDVKAAIAKFIAANNPLTSGVWVMSSSTALALSMMVNALGNSEFPGLTMNGGTFFGLPVITSEHVTDYVALVNAQDVWLGDEGGIDVALSTEASLQMVGGDGEGSTQDSTTPVATSLVSMFQTNSVAFRAERTVSWARRRATGIALIDNITWGAAVGSP